MKIKKIILSAVVLISAWGLPQFAFAQTQYFNFTSYLNAGLPTPGSTPGNLQAGYFSGVFTGAYSSGDNLYNFTRLTGTFNNSTLIDILSTSPDSQYLGHATYTSGNAVLIDLHFSFNTSAGLKDGPYIMSYTQNPNTVFTYSTPNITDPRVGGGSDHGTTFAADVPEIDGSLLPKVGFLLGCLFLIFGRRTKSVTTSKSSLIGERHGGMA